MNQEKHNSSAAAAEVLTQFLRSRGLRRTPERFAVLEMVMDTSRHFTMEWLVERMQQVELSVSRATVYNTMSLLVDCGLVRRHQFDKQVPQYEVVVGKVRANHLHLVCSSCGKVREVYDPEIERMIRARRFDTFHPEQFALSLYGICSRCQRKRKGKGSR